MIVNRTRKIVIGTLLLLFLVIGVFFKFAQYSEAACKTQTNPPSTEPIITSAEPGLNQVTLTWVPAGDPVTYYLLQYGTNPDNLEYGNPYIGDHDTTSYTVQSLNNGTKYYFRIRAGNGCKPGGFSDIESAIPGTSAQEYRKLRNVIYGEKNVLGVSSSADLKKHVISKTDEKSLHCNYCNADKILIGEIIALLLFYLVFYFLRGYSKYTFLVILIPLVSFLYFFFTRKSCSDQLFYCKYFYVLGFSVFVLISAVYKQFFISKRENIYKSIDK